MDRDPSSRRLPCSPAPPLRISQLPVRVTRPQVQGLIARRILSYVTPGDQLSRGQRYGFIRFGSRVDVYLPVSARSEVTIGQKVTGGRTILARW